MMTRVVAAVLTFCSLWFLTVDIRVSAIGMAITLVVAFLAPAFAYFLTALAITAAIGSLILPDRIKNDIKHLALYGPQHPAPDRDAGH
jgi:hypothetical protein